MEWLVIWPIVTVVMLLLYRWRAPATPKRPLVALGLLTYAIGAVLIAGGVVSMVVAVVRGESLFGLPFAALGLLTTWWLTAGFAARFGVPPHALLRHFEQPPNNPDS